MDSILAKANERFTRQGELRRCGYDIQKIAERVAEIYQMDVREIFGGGPAAASGQGAEPSLFLGGAGVGNIAGGSLRVTLVALVMRWRAIRDMGGVHE